MWRDMLYNFAKFTAGFLVIVVLSLSMVVFLGGARGGTEASVFQSIKGFFGK